jgi:hypothetical protein
LSTWLPHSSNLNSGEELFAGNDGIYRIRTFPGLWIHGPALLDRDALTMMSTLTEGLATHEHAAFVKKLSERPGKSKA